VADHRKQVCFRLMRMEGFMGQKVHPVGFRTAIMIPHKSRWYASKKEFSALLLEDFKIRNFIKKHPKKNYAQAGIDRIEIERTRAIETTMDSGAKGIKIQLAGRLGGSEMARCEKATAGSLPLSTLRAKIDYGFAEAWTAQGNIGVQVWINQGMYTGEAADGADAQASEAPKKPKR